MKVLMKEIKEAYSYTSYDEFEAHRAQMIANGYKPSSSTADGYSNKNMDSYYGEYTKQLEWDFR